MVATAEKVREKLLEEGIHATLVNARFAKPFDREYLQAAMKRHKLMVFMEEGITAGGMGESIACFLRQEGYRGQVMSVSIEDTFVEHGNVDTLKEMLGIDADSIYKDIIKQLKERGSQIV